MVGHDCTCTDAGLVVVISRGHYEEYDVKIDVKDYEIQQIKEGWHNPRKINIPKKHILHHKRIQIRNQLPYKFRRVEKEL